MKIILYMAVSIDGYIAKTNGDSDWVSEADVAIFDGLIQESGGIIVGNSTFRQYKWELYPVEGVQNIVISSREDNAIENDTLFVKSVEQAIEIAEKSWLKKVLLIGGGITNSSFLKLDKIDEIIVSVHPIILGKWIKLFEDIEIHKHLELIESNIINNKLVQIHYRVKK